MEAGTRDEGGQALEEFEGRHDDMGGVIAKEHAVPWWLVTEDLPNNRVRFIDGGP